MTSDKRMVLPKEVVPVSYQINLTPNLDEFTFMGEVTIAVSVMSPTKKIVMNCAELEIISSSLTVNGQISDIANISLDQKMETLTLTTKAELVAAKAEVTVKFKGDLNDRLLGFYRSSYTDTDGNKKFLATTQFESTDARRAFPCWDEPEKKATFDVTLTVPKDLTAVSNMPIVVESNVGPNLKSVKFDTTPIMSTYLLAFMVGELASIEKMSKSGTLMRVWTTKGKEEQGRFALDTSLELLDFYNNYFGIPFPLPKLDHLAIPDFAAGAMENWGAITYREVALLVDPDNSSAVTRQIVASIISHEMAHMWFGDLVTMEWWNDLWLNESFASWMGDKAVDAIHPEWDMWTQFLTADTASAFSLDGLANSHPIEQEVSNPAEIGQLFDAISYSKGGSVLRMLEDYIGADAFQLGIRNYLMEHSYANAKTIDLWNSLGDTSGKPVAKVMNSWVQQTGFPVLFASREGDNVSLSQKRFLYDNISSDVDNSDNTQWFVPVTIGAENTNNLSSLLVDSPKAEIQLPEGSGSWFKVNPDQTGFYRVSYDSENLTRLESAILANQLGNKDRLGLQGDAYALCRAGYAPVSSFLKLARSYVSEHDAPVLSDLSSGLRGIENLIEGYPFHQKYKEFCRGIFKQTAETTGWDKHDNESHLEALLRSTVLSNLGHYGDEGTLAEASQRFSSYIEDSETVHPDVRSVVFALAARQGGKDTYDLMWNLEKQSELQEEKVRLHSALASFTEEDLLVETLERSLSDDIRAQDSIRVIVTVASTGQGRSLAWNFIRSNWNELDRRYGDGGFALMRLVSLVSGFSAPDRLKEVEDFFSKNPTPAAARTIDQAKERIRLNVAWLDRYSEEIGQFLEST